MREQLHDLSRDGERRVVHVRSVELRSGESRWAYADRHADAIEAHWQRRRREHPNFFNGAVQLLSDYSVTADGCLHATFIRADFKSFLFWRENGWPDKSVMDAFGSALIFSTGGELLLGQQREGHLNGGLSYPPGGFIDPRDVSDDGAIDIEGSVRREIFEELGLAPDLLRQRAGYIVTMTGPVLSIGVPFDTHLADAELLSSIARHIATDPDPELASARFVARGTDSGHISMPDYARTLIDQLSNVETSI